MCFCNQTFIQGFLKSVSLFVMEVIAKCFPHTKKTNSDYKSYSISPVANYTNSAVHQIWLGHLDCGGTTLQLMKVSLEMSSLRPVNYDLDSGPQFCHGPKL